MRRFIRIRLFFARSPVVQQDARAVARGSKRPRQPKDAVDRARELLRQERHLLAATELASIEAAVVEHLASATDEKFSALRALFPHQISNGSDEVLHRVAALIRGVVEAVCENDAAGLRQAGENDAAGLRQAALRGDEYFGLDTVRGRIRAALNIVHAALRAREDAGMDDALSMFEFRLVAYDPRFGALKRADVVEIFGRARLRATRRGSRIPKGGRGNLSARGVLAKLMAKVGAFDASSEADAKKKIANALAMKARAPRAKNKL